MSSGDRSGDLKKVILTAMRDEGEGSKSTDETTLINILVLSPVEHVRSIDIAYVANYKAYLAITAEFSGDAKCTLLFLVHSVLEPVESLAELTYARVSRAW
ncbi:Annexin (Annexin) Family [Phytophthora cinnamomi]|uniref:Annexin (Annexin) Family n=1 Tax=Phytophthora cinnamomi TaxID=4785 RepID=UPI003559BC4F|nr:Annexin (Annexin) Family [Phytophthora cinnamomi]